MEFSPITAYVISQGKREPALEDWSNANALFFNKKAIAGLHPDKTVEDAVILMARKYEFMGNLKVSTSDPSELLVYKDAPQTLAKPTYVPVPTI
mgnify:CR=1 FL=1